MRNFKKTILRTSNNEFLPLSINSTTNGESLQFRVVTSQADTILVYWGDGTSNVYTTSFSSSLHSVIISHTYSSPYTGVMEISTINGTNGIRRFDNFDTSTNLVVFTIQQIGTFSGLQRFECLDSNAITGDIVDLPTNLISFICQGQNTTTGNISTLPNSMTRYSNFGNNTTTGNINTLKTGLSIYENGGSNTTSGDIKDLPSSLTRYLNWGNNTTTGDIKDLSTNLVYYNNIGNNTTFGDIADLKSNLTTYQNWGSNTTVGNIVNIKPQLTFFSNDSNNSLNIITGDLADLLTLNLTHFTCIGFNTISGDVSLISPNIVYFSLQANAHDLTYATDRIWADNMQYIFINPNDGSFIPSMTDDLLIDLAKDKGSPSANAWVSFSGTTPRRVSTPLGRTSVSDSAVLTLAARGATYVQL